MSNFPASAPPPQRFCSPGLRQFLLRHGLATEAELDNAESKAGNRKALSALCESKALQEGPILERVAKNLGFSSADLGPLTVAHLPPRERLERVFDRRFALRNRCLPVSFQDESLTIAVCDPLDVEVVQAIEYALQTSVKLLLAAEADILRLADRYLPEDESEGTSVAAALHVETIRPPEETGEDGDSESPPAVRLVNRMLGDAIQMGASDVHLIPNEDVLDVLFRIDGVMEKQFTIPRKYQASVLSRIKLISRMNIAERRRPQDGAFRVKWGDSSARDVRSSVVLTPYGEKAALRLLEAQAARTKLEELGMPWHIREALERSLNASNQLVVVCGPTGSGKTTTLYAAISQLNTGKLTIVTVEDPVEVRLPGLTQIQVDPKIGVTFAGGLRSILRQDPDVILVGETRDRETAETAFQAAQTGHLVLTTLHTNDAPATVSRLADLGVEPYVIASSLRAILAQRLVRRNCPRCSVPLPAPEARELADRFGFDTAHLTHGTGCDYCEQRGYKGRIGIYSLLDINDELRVAIRERWSPERVAEVAERNGFQDLNRAGLALVEQGVTTMDELERVLGPVTAVPRQAKIAESRKRRPVKPAAGNSVEALAEKRPEARVLLVDDNPAVRRIMTKVLAHEGFTVLEAGDGLEALQVLEGNPVDAVLCDLMMPRMNGRDFVRAVRKRPDGAQCKLLMLTSSDCEENEVALFEAGADDFMSKSSTPKVVVARLRRLLKG